MTAKADAPEKPADKGGPPSAAEIARMYLDLWEKNLALAARCGVVRPDRPKQDGDTRDG